MGWEVIGRRSLRLSPLTGIVLTLLLLASSGCDDSSSSGDAAAVRYFFGTNNIRECSPITVEIDLLAADAAIEHREDDSLDCTIDAALEGAGCFATFDEVDGGDRLLAVISGCEVPPTTNLFDCNFSRGDPALIDSSTDAVCDCVGEQLCFLNFFCDPTPTICLTEDGNPSGCEDCFNGIDDNGDGFTDCRDSNCFIAGCGYGQSTITCSTTSTSTTTTSTTLSLRRPR